MSLRREWNALRAFWYQEFRYDFRDSAIAFLILVVIGYLAARFLPLIQDWLTDLMTELMAQEGLVTADGSLSASGLLASNLQACLTACLYGLIPFLYLPALALGLNAMLLGGLAALIQAQGSPLFLYLAAVLPHGIFEIPALCLAFSLGLRLCAELTKICRKREHQPFSSIAASSGRVFVFCVLPLLAAAACVEAWITPRLIGLLM